VKPQSQQDLRVRRRTTRHLTTRLDPSVELAQVQSRHKRPHRASPVIRRKLAVEIHHVPPKLPTISLLHPGLITHPILPGSTPIESSYPSPGNPKLTNQQKITGPKAGMTHKRNPANPPSAGSASP